MKKFKELTGIQKFYAWGGLQAALLLFAHFTNSVSFAWAISAGILVGVGVVFYNWFKK